MEITETYGFRVSYAEFNGIDDKGTDLFHYLHSTLFNLHSHANYNVTICLFMPITCKPDCSHWSRIPSLWLSLRRPSGWYGISTRAFAYRAAFYSKGAKAIRATESWDPLCAVLITWTIALQLNDRTARFCIFPVREAALVQSSRCYKTEKLELPWFPGIIPTFSCYKKRITWFDMVSNQVTYLG